MGDPLKVRLFGYGTPYRVSVGAEGAVVAGETDEEKEAGILYHTLRGHVGRADKPSSADAAGQWSYSMPFGRCGVDDLPREHLLVYNACEAHLDVLSDQGLATRHLGEGEIAHIEPGTVVRLRALPRPRPRRSRHLRDCDREPPPLRRRHGHRGLPAPELQVDWRADRPTGHAAGRIPATGPHIIRSQQAAQRCLSAADW